MDEQEQRNTVSNEEQKVNQIAPTPPPSHKKLIIGVVIAVVLVIAGAAGAYFVFQPKAKLVDELTFENILDRAIDIEDSEVCAELQNTKMRDECYYEYSWFLDEPDSCLKILDADFKLDCVFELAGWTTFVYSA